LMMDGRDDVGESKRTAATEGIAPGRPDGAFGSLADRKKNTGR
jgi:hypothetical protein